MRTSETITKIIPAIHNVQQAVESISKTSKAEVGKYSYKYADMTTIWNAIKGQLKMNGLTIIQSPTNGNGQMMGDMLNTTIYHESGEFISETMNLVITRQDPQGVGGAITYARRYMLTAMFGLVTDDDNDASTQRLADGEMKKDWVRAFTIVMKKITPESTPTMNDFMKFMVETYGTHPTKVMAKDHQNVLETIRAFDPGESSEISDGK